MPSFPTALAAALLAVTLATGLPANAKTAPAPPLPAAVAAEAPGLTLRGGGDFRFFGLAVYDGWLWTAGAPFDAPFALDLHYHREIEGSRIAQRSAEEIAKLGYGSADERAAWTRWMERAFPDVRRGDRLTGVYLPGRGLRFFHNGRALAASEDAAFARAFFAIWLDPRTSRPDFRDRLLGAQ